MILYNNNIANIAWRAAKTHQFKLVRYHLVRELASCYLLTKTIKDRVFTWPPFNEESDAEEYSTYLFNARHYLKGLDIRIELFLETKNGILRCSSEAPYDRVTRHEYLSAEKAKREKEKARYCAVWRLWGIRWGSSYLPHLYNIERKVGHYDVNEWLRLASDIFLEDRAFPENTVALPPHPVEACAILGSGPSYEHFLSEAQFFDGWIGANSIACDQRMLRAGKPFALCILDPYIFSPLDSMRLTLEGAFRLVRETPAVLITTRQFAPFVELNFPLDVKKKCHYLTTLGLDGVFCGRHKSLSRLMTIPYGNVLTDLMLPVAANISNRVVIYGCDGNKPGSDFLEYGKGVSQMVAKQFEESASIYDYSSHGEYLQMHNIFTRYVIDYYLGKGINISLRSESWNAGLRHLPVMQCP